MAPISGYGASALHLHWELVCKTPSRRPAGGGGGRGTNRGEAPIPLSQKKKPGGGIAPGGPPSGHGHDLRNVRNEP